MVTGQEERPLAELCVTACVTSDCSRACCQSPFLRALEQDVGAPSALVDVCSMVSWNLSVGRHTWDTH